MSHVKRLYSMLQRLVILTMLLCAVNAAFAQDEEEEVRPFAGQGKNYFNQPNDTRIFFGGLAAGMNFTQVDGDSYSGYNKLGFNGGAMVYVKLAKRLLTNVQLLYTQRGSRGIKVYDDYYTGTAIAKYYLDLNYVEVPLILHYLVNPKWQIGIGASYSQLINSKEEAYSPYAYTIRPGAQQFRKQDWELILSGTMQIYRGWFVHMAYQYSLNTIRDIDKVPVGFTTGGPQFNNYFSLRLVRLIRSGN